MARATLDKAGPLGVGETLGRRCVVERAMLEKGFGAGVVQRLTLGRRWGVHGWALSVRRSIRVGWR